MNKIITSMTNKYGYPDSDVERIMSRVPCPNLMTPCFQAVGENQSYYVSIFTNDRHSERVFDQMYDFCYTEKSTGKEHTSLLLSVEECNAELSRLGFKDSLN